MSSNRQVTGPDRIFRDISFLKYERMVIGGERAREMGQQYEHIPIEVGGMTLREIAKKYGIARQTAVRARRNGYITKRLAPSMEIGDMGVIDPEEAYRAARVAWFGNVRKLTPLNCKNFYDILDDVLQEGVLRIYELSGRFSNGVVEGGSRGKFNYMCSIAKYAEYNYVKRVGLVEEWRGKVVSLDQKIDEEEGEDGDTVGYFIKGGEA